MPLTVEAYRTVFILLIVLQQLLRIVLNSDLITSVMYCSVSQYFRCTYLLFSPLHSVNPVFVDYAPFCAFSQTPFIVPDS